jgi:hypothetical protein
MCGFNRLVALKAIREFPLIPVHRIGYGIEKAFYSFPVFGIRGMAAVEC